MINDTALLTGGVNVNGILDTTDNNDTALLVGERCRSPEPTTTDTHDGFTPEEIRRARNLDRKIREKQLALYKAQARSQETQKTTITGCY